MNLEKKYSYIDLVMSLTPGGMKTGRDAIISLLSHIGSPQNNLKVFHVTGSNGKGSVCQMISQVIYKQFKRKVGLFTSPHLVDVTERFQINGKPITHSKLNSYYKKIIDLAKKYSIELSFFEIQVVATVLYFSDEKVDYAVVEVGLGGLYDGTNIFEYPVACFITSVTLEHTYLLGKTRKSVLKNKLGIVKEGTTLYTHLKNKQISEYCRKKGAHLGVITQNNTQSITNLPGKHQQKNALLVFQALSDLGFDSQKILTGLQNIYNPGRFEWLSSHLLADTANNEENIKLLGRMIEDAASQTTLIFGTTQIDPIYTAKLINMFPEYKKILVDGFCERALPCSEYSRFVRHDTLWHLDTSQGIKNFEDIIKNRRKNQKYILFGSIYLVGYAMILSRYNIFAKH